MVRAVIELPDAVHAKRHDLAARRGVSVGQMLREMAEQTVNTPIRDTDAASDAVLSPAARDMGTPGIAERYWREVANEPGAVVERLAHDGRLDDLDQP